MTFAELLAEFVDWRRDIDSEPYKHQAEHDQFVGDCLKESAP